MSEPISVHLVKNMNLAVCIRNLIVSVIITVEGWSRDKLRVEPKGKAAPSPWHCRCRTDTPFDLALHLTLTLEQNLKMTELLHFGRQLTP